MNGLKQHPWLISFIKVSRLKKADKVGAKFALILGEAEIEENKVSIKFLRDRQEQQQVPNNQIDAFLKNNS